MGLTDSFLLTHVRVLTHVLVLQQKDIRVIAEVAQKSDIWNLPNANQLFAEFLLKRLVLIHHLPHFGLDFFSEFLLRVINHNIDFFSELKMELELFAVLVFETVQEMDDEE